MLFRSSNSQNQRTEETVNYEISKTVQTEVKHSGNVKRISAAVLVDGTYDTAPDGTQTYKPREQADLDKIAALVKSAIGYDEKRGDVVEVSNMQFAAPDTAAVDTGLILGLEKQDIMRIAELLVLSVIAILVLLLVVRPLLNRLLALPSIAPEGGLALAGPGGAALPPGAAAALAIAGPDGRPQSLGDLAADQGMGDVANVANEIEQMIDINQVEGRVRASSLRKISEMVDRHPEQAVNIMRQWIYQDQ